MVFLSRAAIVAAVVVPSGALTIKKHIQHGPPIFKKVRSIIYNGQHDIINDSGRDLQATESVTLRCFYQCLEQGMTSEQCVKYIQDTLGEDLSLHEIPDLNIKVSPPRTAEAKAESYWMFGIPTNIYGQVDCDINNGIIEYPWKWETAPGVSEPVPPVDCIGLDAHDCCNKFLTEVSAAGIPLVDVNGNCLSCWVHQEPLEPVISAATGELAYLEHSFDPTSGSCAVSELKKGEVQATDDEVETVLVDVRAGIDTILGQQPVNCGAFINLHQDLLFYGRAFPHAMSEIAGLLCGICATPEDEYELTQDMILRLQFIKVKLSGEINSDENCIIIYTDHKDLVLEPPKIGGSRHELDFDRDDPDCEGPDPTGDNPDGPDGPVDGPNGTDCPVGKHYDPIRGCICDAGLVDDNMGGCVPEGPDGPTDGPDGPTDGPEGPTDGPDGPTNEPNSPNSPDSPDGPTDGLDGPDGPTDGPDGPEENDDRDLCPEGSIRENGACYMTCTIGDILEGKISECQGEYKDCLLEECGRNGSNEWNSGCLDLITGKSPFSADGMAWKDCFKDGQLNVSPDGGPQATTSGVSMKSKNKSVKASKTKSTKSIKSNEGPQATTAGVSTKSKNKSAKAKSNKPASKKGKKRRVRRELRNLGSSKQTKAAKSGKASKTKSKSSTKSKSKATGGGTSPAPGTKPDGGAGGPDGGAPREGPTMCTRTCSAVGRYMVDTESPAPVIGGPGPTKPVGNVGKTSSVKASTGGSAKTSKSKTKTKTKSKTSKSKTASTTKSKKKSRRRLRRL